MSAAPKPEDMTPARQSRRFTCPHCGTFAAQDWRELYYKLDTYDDDYVFRLAENFSPATVPQDSIWGSDAPASNEPVWVVGATWAQSICSGCDQVATWRDKSLVYPRSSTAPFPHADMPSSVKVLYDEARMVVEPSRRAAAAMARATLELLLRDQDPEAPKSDRLDDRIIRIEKRVSSSLGELLQYIRHVGNKSLHVEAVADGAVVIMLDPTQQEPVEAIFTAINDLVDELITKPERTRRLTSTIPDDVKAGVELKRARQSAADDA